MIGLVISNILVSFTALYYISRYYKLTKSHVLFLEEKELETLKECVDYHIDMLEQATGRAQSKEMRARFLLTKNTMLDIRKKLEEK